MKTKIFYLPFILLIFILITSDFTLIAIIRKNLDIFTKKQKNYNHIEKSNINLSDEFFKIKSVKRQIEAKKLSYIKTICGGRGKIGNALIMLNNLINICEKIICKNIIAPEGLHSLIKNPIYDKEYNITIFPSKYRKIIHVDIMLSRKEIFWFHYISKPHLMRLKIIREEVLKNIPKYESNLNDLIIITIYIHIRSGDIMEINILTFI